MSLEALAFERFYKDFVAPNGLARLDPEDRDGDSVKNENGILFLALTLVTAKIAGCDVTRKLTSFFLTTTNLQEQPGLYNRAPHHNRRDDAHDNYVGVCAGSVLYKLQFAREIIEYGLKTGYNYNNVPPYFWSARHQRQGGEIAFYHLCAGYTPSPFDYAWFIVGLLLSTHRSPGEVQLGWLRLWAISNRGYVTPWVSLSLPFVRIAWKALASRKHSGIADVFSKYFLFKEHPIHQIAANIKGWGL